jgi:EmrB/QacA subfamily drug resistance transporter
MVMPTTLSIIDNVFPQKERARAIGIWSGIAGGGIALGSILTGFLLEHYSWNSVFILSGIIGIIGLIFNQHLTPNSRDHKKTPVDWVGGFFSVVGLLGLVYGIIESPSLGLTSPRIMASLGVGVISIIAFIWWQRRSAHPMLDMKLFRIPAFGISALSIMLAFFALMGVFFSMSQLFQLIMGYGTLESSFRLMPMMLLMMFTSPFVPSVVKKIGARWTVSSGLLLVSLGFLSMAMWPADPHYWQVIASMIIMMSGMALTMTPSTNMLMSSVPRNRAGMGSATNDTTRELGGALGVAILGSVLASVYTDKIASAAAQLPAQTQMIAEHSLAGALGIAKQLGPNGSAFATAAKHAWMQGFTQATIIAACIVAVAAVVAAIWLPHHQPHRDDEIFEPVVKE